MLRGIASTKPSGRLIFYATGHLSKPQEADYRSLYKQATQNSRIIRSLGGFHEGCTVLIHFECHWDNILWFWSVLLANAIPVPSSPLSNVPEHRRKHLQHLSALLEGPICITRAEKLVLFDGVSGIRLYTAEAMLSQPLMSASHDGPARPHSGAAVLMLTSGSTGHAKAVRLSHRNILAAIRGKASVRKLPANGPFLNWIGVDHVASLVESHLHAMYLGVDQIHVHAVDVLSSPRSFLRLLSYHRVARSFAPNFFLAKLVAAMKTEDYHRGPGRPDLRNLAVLASGGEANDVETVAAAAAILSKYGAPKNVITPGFGMTETCAGAIFNLDCPNYDVHNNRPFASLGKCMPGIEVRITLPTGTPRGPVMLARANEPGNLEVRGDVVFDGYYRNSAATADAFLPDRWFRTGDTALLDKEGNLYLLGRLSDVVDINGIKLNTADIQTWIDQELGSRLSRTVCFPSQAPSASGSESTEQITVAYVPSPGVVDAADLVDMHDKIVETCLISTGSRPQVFALPDDRLLPVTSLGKISRVRVRTLFENGIFDQHITAYNSVIHTHRARSRGLPTSEAESHLLQDFADILGTDATVIGTDTPIFDLGFTSMDLIRLKRRIDIRLAIDIPLLTLMTNSTARLLATALSPLLSPCSSCTDDTPAPYSPIVTLRTTGSKPPLWLIHPAAGDILVFINLVHQLASDDRPIYALRARGLEPSEAPFTSIDEVITTYHAAIREKQPTGPYVIAGYGYGGALAFELAKRLESDPENETSPVAFLGVLNTPPHIKTHTRHVQANFNLTLLHLSHALGIVTEMYALGVESAGFGDLDPEDATARLLAVADKVRMADLGFSVDGGLERWAKVAHGMQSMAVNYEPEGRVGAVDVFHAGSGSLGDDVDHLSRWAEFAVEPVRIHEVDGEEYTMLRPENVLGFATVLKKAMRDRGV
ncbi:acyl-protein synthetase [Podospora appendiculata]|uniref:Acyl-protein synthetase n=1 Tax=Podospora appendiculata TaxID=314037 RepID=A0AAE1CD42_9PEZI|nr:acyl-protein synthetase [Podospora appendiculata]